MAYDLGLTEPRLRCRKPPAPRKRGNLHALLERDLRATWISKHRRTTRDYERLPASHEAMILWAMIASMTRRLARPVQ